MRYLFLLMPFLLHAQTYMAKIEPIQTYTLMAQTSGQIIELDKNDESKVVNKRLIKLDDNLDKSTLNLYKKQEKLQEDKIKILQDNYDKFSKLKSKSKSEKDIKKISLLEAKNSLVNLKVSIQKLKDTINKKNIYANNLYIDSFLVNKGDFVSQGTKLAKAYDISSSKLIIYVNKDDYKNIKYKTILINKEKNKASFYKISLILDDTYISSYKIELKYQSKDFGKIVEVEFLE